MYPTFLKKHTFKILTSVVLVLSSCSILQKSPSNAFSSYTSLDKQDQALADSLLRNVMDNEGLFTVISGLKPISSAGDLVIRTADSNATDQKLLKYQRVVNALNFGDLKFVISPFRMHDPGERILQVNVYRQRLVDSIVLANQSFYRQLGYLPGADAKLIINSTEYEDKVIRFRSYGNLFGYPPHAVDFFVTAETSRQASGKFVERSFFQIPVHSGEKGHFVYALPKNSTPGSADLAIRSRATYHLSKYQEVRKKFVNRDSTLRAYPLLKKLLKLSER